jgi:hypothetical protein
MHRRSCSAVVALALVAALSACSGSKGSASSSGSTGTTTTSSAPTKQSDTSPAGQTKAKATCDQLTVADVQPLVAGTVSKHAPQAAGAGDNPGQDCQFPVDDDEAIDVTVLPNNTLGQDAYASAVKEEGADAIPVNGVGEKASRKKGDITVNALSGSVYCTVSAEASEMPGIGDWESSHGGTSDVPDSIVGPAVDAIGTLCNRIYGSGNTTPDLNALKTAVSAAH